MTWYVYYDGKGYKLMDSKAFGLNPVSWIAQFNVFDMAYQYVTRLNGTNDVQAYSKWTVGR